MICYWASFHCCNWPKYSNNHWTIWSHWTVRIFNTRLPSKVALDRLSIQQFGQCDQISGFFKVLGHKFALKYSPKRFLTVRLFWKRSINVKNCCWILFGHLLKTFGQLFWSSIWSHWNRLTLKVFRFEWKMNGEKSFLTDGSFGAITHPINFNVNDSNSEIFQLLSIAPSSTGSYVLRCDALQFGYENYK